MNASTLRLLATTALVACAMPVAATAQLTDAETTTDPAEETNLTCRAEVAALRDTIRSEDGYTGIAPRFEELIAAADQAAVEAEDGVCYVRLLEARQLLAGSGIAVEGYSDQVTIYDTIAAAQAAGALSNTDVATARAATVQVEARPARVAVTPQAAQVQIEQAATEIGVTQRPAEIVVEQAPANVAVQQAQPNIAVTQAPANVDVDAPAPEVQVIQPEPRIAVTQAQPQIEVTQTPPQISVTQAEPTVTIRQFEPEIEVIQQQPQITVNQPEPEIAVVQPEPEVTVTPAEPVVTIGQAQPEVSVEYNPPEVNVTQRAPEVTVDAAEPQIEVAEAQPQVSVEQSQPTVDVDQPAPIVSVEQSEPTVDFEQRDAIVTAELSEAEVEVNTAETAQVETIDEGEAEITVTAEGEPVIEVVNGVAVDTQALVIAEETAIAIEEVEFGFDSDALTDVAVSNVEDALDALTDDHTAVLVGYASPIGDEDYNLDLSERRVDAVRAAMLDRGANPEQIVVRAIGEIDSEATVDAQGRSEENRRVDIKILPSSAFARR